MPLFAGYNHKKFYKKRRPKSGRLFLCLRDLAFIKIPILLIFCPYFPLQLWLHSSLCARRCNKNYKQKTLRNIGTSIFAKSLSIIFISVLVPVKDSYALCKKLPVAEVVQYQHVYDGDTILLKDGRKVRLIGINAPEIGRKGKASQAFAQKSKHKLKQLLSTSPIINLSYDLEKKDRYNRSLAYIYLPDGTAVQTVDTNNVYLMTSILQDVIKKGTGRKARSLKRDDIGGKTGTTYDQVDAWFSGFNKDFATTTWVGFDKPRSMGRYETGGKAALPMWIRFMKTALEQSPDVKLPVPDDIISVKIDAETAQLAGKNTKQSLFEYFIKDSEPEENSSIKSNESLQNNSEDVELF